MDVVMRGSVFVFYDNVIEVENGVFSWDVEVGEEKLLFIFCGVNLII